MSGKMDRAQLLENAVKFLQDPQVRQSEDSRKIGFLEKKGLSKEEIQQALRLAGGSSSCNASAGVGSVAPPPLPAMPPRELVVGHAGNGRLQRNMDWGKFAIIVALIGSAGIALSQSYLVVSKGSQGLVSNGGKLILVRCEF